MAVQRTQEYWRRELNFSERKFNPWFELSDKIYKRYGFDTAQGKDPNNFNVLWSNIETMMPAVFTQVPKIEVQRRFSDRDPNGRLSAMVLRRAVAASLDMDEIHRDAFDTVCEKTALDLLLTGRAVSWVTYDPLIGRSSEGQEIIQEELAPIEHIMQRYFLHSIRHSWGEINKNGWVARRLDMTREEGIEKFGNVFRNVSLDAGMVGDSEVEMPDEVVEDPRTRSQVWEIWDAETRKVFWVNKDAQNILGEQDDPLGLQGFFPCPRPAYTATNNFLVPIPDFTQYKKFADEVEDLSIRIDDLAQAVKVRGVYDAAAGDIGTLLSQEGNSFVPVENFLEIQAKGGLHNIVQYLPIDEIAKALVSLYDARERAKNAMYEISGIADILRGVVHPSEKLGQSNLKARFAGQRIDKRRRMVENHLQGCLSIKAEIVCEHFDPQRIRTISGYDMLPEVEELVYYNQQVAQIHAQAAQAGGVDEQGNEIQLPPMGESADDVFQNVVELLRDEFKHYRLDVESSSTLHTDSELEQERRMEFLEAAGGYMNQAVQMSQIDPRTSKLSAELLMFAIRSFPKGKELESTFEELVEELKNPPPPPPQEEIPPEQQQAQPELTPEQAEYQAQYDDLDLQEKQTKLEIARIEAMSKMQSAQNRDQKEKAELEMKLLEARRTNLRLNQEMLVLQEKMVASRRATGLESVIQ